MNVDALVLKQMTKSFTNIFVFFRHQPLVGIGHRNIATKSSHRLGQFYSDIAAADNEEMFGNLVEFERLDMRERLCFSKARNRCQRGPGTRTDDHVCAAQLTGRSISESHVHGSRSNKPSVSQNELRSGFSVGFQIHLVHARYHLALAFADA